MSLLTTQDVCTLLGKTQPTLYNWRAGFRWRNGKREYYFDDHSTLPHTHDPVTNQPFYKEEDVLGWVSRLKEIGKTK